MSEPMHVSDETLIQLINGEGSANGAQVHLAQCAQCTGRLEQLKNSLGEFMRYREMQNQFVPAPPSAWPDLAPRLAELERGLNLRVMPRHKPLAGLRPLHLMAAAACILIAALLVRRFQTLPSVRADELIRKAVAAQAAAPLEPMRRIRVKARGRVFVRPAFLPVDAENPDLKRTFAAAGFNWDNPLSAASFAAWRDQLAEKTDVVEELFAGDDAGPPVYRIRSTTNAGPLHQATLTIRQRDLRPVKEMLEFTSETVEISEVSTGDAAAQTAGARVGITLPLPEPTGGVAPPQTKLMIFSALHQIGADLGEQIEIRPGAAKITVVATGLTAGRRGEVEAALKAVAGVDLQFEQAGAMARAATPVDPATAASAPLQSRLQALLGSRQSAEEFTNRALDSSDAVMARVYALRALALAFSPQTEATLTAADRQVLIQLRDDHSTKLSQEIAALQSALQPVVTSAARPAMAGLDAPWQSAAEQLFTVAQQLDHALNVNLAAAPAAGEAVGFDAITGPLARLQAQYAAYERSWR